MTQGRKHLKIDLEFLNNEPVSSKNSVSLDNNTSGLIEQGDFKSKKILSANSIYLGLIFILIGIGMIAHLLSKSDYKSNNNNYSYRSDNKINQNDNRPISQNKTYSSESIRKQDSPSTKKNPSASSISPMSQNDSDKIFNCSEYHHLQAKRLEPSQEELLRLKVDLNELIRLKKEIEELKQELDFYPSEKNSQLIIDQYNLTVDKYNSKLKEYDALYDSLEKVSKAYDFKVQQYNDYLKNNCVLQK